MTTFNITKVTVRDGSESVPISRNTATQLTQRIQTSLQPYFDNLDVPFSNKPFKVFIKKDADDGVTVKLDGTDYFLPVNATDLKVQQLFEDVTPSPRLRPVTTSKPSVDPSTRYSETRRSKPQPYLIEAADSLSPSSPTPSSPSQAALLDEINSLKTQLERQQEIIQSQDQKLDIVTHKDQIRTIKDTLPPSSLVSRLKSYIPFTKPSLDPTIVELYKHLYNYYTLERDFLKKNSTTLSTGERLLLDLLNSLYKIEPHYSPIEFIEILNTIDDANHSQNLDKNKATIEASIKTLSEKTNKTKSSPHLNLPLIFSNSEKSDTSIGYLSNLDSLICMEKTNLANGSPISDIASKNRLEVCDQEAIIYKHLHSYYTSRFNTLEKPITDEYLGITAKNAPIPEEETHLKTLLKLIPANLKIIAPLEYGEILDDIDTARRAQKLMLPKITKIQNAIQEKIAAANAKVAAFSKTPEGQLYIFSLSDVLRRSLVTTNRQTLINLIPDNLRQEKRLVDPIQALKDGELIQLDLSEMQKKVQASIDKVMSPLPSS